jgi:hypothetical protein
MSTDPKPPKPMPSAEEINAYLEQSAARTKLRLPLAAGAARVGAAPAAGPDGVEQREKRPLPLGASKKLQTRQEQPSRADDARSSPTETGPAEVWRPFSNDGEG